MKNTVKWLEGMLYPLDKALEKDEVLTHLEVSQKEWEATDDALDIDRDHNYLRV